MSELPPVGAVPAADPLAGTEATATGGVGSNKIAGATASAVAAVAAVAAAMEVTVMGAALSLGCHGGEEAAAPSEDPVSSPPPSERAPPGVVGSQPPSGALEVMEAMSANALALEALGVTLIAASGSLEAVASFKEGECCASSVPIAPRPSLPSSVLPVEVEAIRPAPAPRTPVAVPGASTAEERVVAVAEVEIAVCGTAMASGESDVGVRSASCEPAIDAGGGGVGDGCGTSGNPSSGTSIFLGGSEAIAAARALPDSRRAAESCASTQPHCGLTRNVSRPNNALASPGLLLQSGVVAKQSMACSGRRWVGKNEASTTRLAGSVEALADAKPSVGTGTAGPSPTPSVVVDAGANDVTIDSGNAHSAGVTGVADPPAGEIASSDCACCCPGIVGRHAAPGGKSRDRACFAHVIASACVATTRTGEHADTVSLPIRSASAVFGVAGGVMNQGRLMQGRR